MRLLSKGVWFRAAIGLIAAYAVALQTLFAALAPVPVNANGIDHAAWSVICFGSGPAAPSGDGNPDAPAPASGKFHCVLCGTAMASAAILPDVVAGPAPGHVVSFVAFAPVRSAAPARRVIRTGAARAPPLTA